MYRITIVLIVVFSVMAVGQNRRLAVLQVPLDEPTPKQQLLGEPILLKLKEDARAPRDFRVRVFRGTKEQLLARRADHDGCVEFPTVVWQATVNGRIHLQSLDDRAWLSNKGRDPENYLLVFESGHESGESKIRIHKTQLVKYFSVAFSLKLVPPQNISNAVVEAVESAVEATEQEVTKKFARLPQGPCSRVVDVESVAVVATTRKKKHDLQEIAVLTVDGCNFDENRETAVSK